MLIKINKIKIAIALFFWLLLPAIGFAQKDTSEIELSKYVRNYLSSVPLDIDSLIAASDYLINLTPDTAIQASVAGTLLNEFYDSKIMGVEAVAIHIAKNYFLNHKLRWKNRDSFFALKLYVACNEHSLLGMDAPELNLEALNGKRLSLRNIQSDYTLVLFYDESCPNCVREIPLLKAVLNGFKDKKISVYAVYTEADTSLLKPYLKREFPSFSPLQSKDSSNWHFVWDPNFESNFQILYNVMKKPQIFLLDKNKKIIGRNLNSEALKSLLLAEDKHKETETNNLERFLYNYLSLINMKEISEIDTAFNQLYKRCIIKPDKQAYTTIFSKLSDYLYNTNDEDHDRALILLYNKYIKPNTKYFKDSSYVNSYLPEIIRKIESDMPGNKAHPLKLYTIDNKEISLYSIKSDYTILYFFNPECAVCEAFSEEIKKIYNSIVQHGGKLIAVYTGSDYNQLINYIDKTNPLWEVVWDKNSLGLDLWKWYNIRNVPQVYLLDKNKKIIANRINTIQLEKLIK